MTEVVRTFIAIELNEETHSELSSLLSALKESDADVKWVAPEIIHLTLKFLGYIDEAKVKEVQEILSEVVKNFKPFT